MAGIRKTGVSSVYFTSAALFLILMTLGAGIKSVRSQSCAQDISNLNICSPFVLPGQNVATPSVECCSALQGVDQSCICNALRIAARIPSACRLPALTCGNVLMSGNVPEVDGTWRRQVSIDVSKLKVSKRMVSP